MQCLQTASINYDNSVCEDKKQEQWLMEKRAREQQISSHVSYTSWTS